MDIRDIATIVLYFVLLAGIGVVVFRKRQKTSDDYFLAGRSVPWFMIMASLFATDMSSTAFIGAAGNGYTSGLLFSNFQWVAVVCVLILVLWLLPVYLRNRIVTLPEFLDRRYGPSARVIYSIISILIYVLVEVPTVLYASSLLLATVTPLDHTTIFLVLGVLTGVYTVAGGLRAVIYADFMQAAFILVGGLYLGFASLHEVGGWGALQQQLPHAYFSAIQPTNHPVMPWPTLPTGLLVLGIWYWATNQMILQRVLGAKSINEGRLGALGAGLLKFTLPPMLVLPGMCALVLFPALKNGDLAYPTLIQHLVPVGFKGLVIAAFIAAMMSHIEGALNSASTLYVKDIHIPLINPKTSDAASIRIGKIVGFFIIAIGLVLAQFLQNLESIYVHLQKGYSFAAAPAVVLFLGGIWWKRANLSGAIAAYIGGVGTLLYLDYLAPAMKQVIPNWLGNPFYAVAWAALVALILFVVVSVATPAPSQAQMDSGAPYQEEPMTGVPLLKRWPIWAGACVVGLIGTYLVFR
jgi:SSS family solute:Na+ symporter